LSASVWRRDGRAEETLRDWPPPTPPTRSRLVQVPRFNMNRAPGTEDISKAGLKRNGQWPAQPRSKPDSTMPPLELPLIRQHDEANQKRGYGFGDLVQIPRRTRSPDRLRYSVRNELLAAWPVRLEVAARRPRTGQQSTETRGAAAIARRIEK